MLDQVRNIASRLRAKTLDEEDFVVRVFGKVWEDGCQTFRADTAGTMAEQRRRTRAWLGTILRNLLLDELRSRRGVMEFVNDAGTEKQTIAENDREPVSEAAQLIQLVGSTLSERDAKVVWFKIDAYSPATRNAEPDAADVDKFCSEIGISPEHLRKIYSRAIKTLRDLMAPISP